MTTRPFVCAGALFLAPAACAQVDEAPALSLVANAPNGLVDEARTTLQVKASGGTSRGALEIRVRGVDWNGAEILQSTTPLDFAGNSSIAIPLSLARYGSYQITAQLWRRGEAKPLRETLTRLVRPAPVPKLDAPTREKSWIGVNTHFNAPWDSLRVIGVHHARDYSWGWLGDPKSKPPMSGNGVNFGPTWKKANEAGVSILPILARSFYNEDKTGWTSDSARVSNAYEELGRAFPGVSMWELDNEPEYGLATKRIDLDNYRTYIKAAREGLKRAGNAEVVLAGTAGMKVGDTRELLRRDVANRVDEDFSVVNYHYYTGGAPLEGARSNTNESATDEAGGTILDVQKEINRLAHQSGKQAWLTEFGWDALYGFAVGERGQAIYLPRAYLLARSVGTDKAFWYFDRDARGTGKYASCGLFDKEWIARPSAAALAALSSQTALCTPAGTLDLGPNKWSVVLQKPDGGFVVTAWTLTGRAPVPAPLKGATAFDIFGNPTRPSEISPEVTYFHLDTLPAAWEGQRRAELVSPSVMSAPAGENLEVSVLAPNAKLRWESLPKGVQSASWKEENGVHRAQLQLAPDARPQTLKLTALASGANWTRRFPLEIGVQSAASVQIGAYSPGETLRGEVRAARTTIQTATLSSTKAEVEPASGAVSSTKALEFSVTPPASARGPIPLSLALSGGARQTIWLRPRVLLVPRVAPKIDARGDDTAAKLEARAFVMESEFAPEASFGWSSAGLLVAARMPADPTPPTDPQNFWEWTNLELFVDTDPNGQSWNRTARQFYFVPRETNSVWTIAAGEFRRSPNLEKTTFDDARFPSSVRREGENLWIEVLIPASVLGAAPAPGQSWRAALSMHRTSRTQSSADAMWPVPKGEGVLEGRNWGVLQFVP